VVRFKSERSLVRGTEHSLGERGEKKEKGKRREKKGAREHHNAKPVEDFTDNTGRLRLARKKGKKGGGEKERYSGLGNLRPSKVTKQGLISSPPT